MATLTEFIDQLPPALDTQSSHPGSATLAARIRSELALAVTYGVFPAGTEFSVRLRRGGFTTSLTLEFVRWEGGPVLSDEYMTRLMEAFTTRSDPSLIEVGGRGGIARYSPAFATARRDAERIAERHNYDRSDSHSDYFDVGYYLSLSSAGLERAAQTGIRGELDPAFATLRHEAVQFAATMPKAFVKSKAREGLENADEHTLKSIVKWGQRSAAACRPIVFSKREGWHIADLAMDLAA